VNLDEILCEGDDIENDLDSILLNPVTSSISKWRTFKFLRWARLLNRLVDVDEIYMGVMALDITSTPYYLMS
jgi:hypothetical protein